MLKNYFVIALRSFRKNKAYSLLNVLGLAIGLACCLFVFTIIRYENSFDNWHTKKDRIYRVVSHYHGDNRIYYSGILPYPTGDAILRDLPDFEKVVQFHGPEDEKISLIDASGNFQVFRQSGILYTDEHFFEVMDFEILKGAPGDALKDPYKVYLTQEMATKYYGDENPIGKMVKLNNDKDLEVVGIVQTPPKNTNLPFKMIVSLPTMRLRMPDVFRDNWGMTWAYSCYALAPEDADIPELERKLDAAMDAYDRDLEDREKSTIKLQPLSEIHNDERYGDGQNYVTPSLMIWAFVLLGALILGTACLNFINLSTAQAIRRAKEVGVRKVLGSLKSQLFWQFMIEILVIVLVGMVIALTLGQILISKFNTFLTEIEYDLSYGSDVIWFAILLAVVVAFFAGLYPALILSGYKPVDALNHKINIRKGSGNINLRRVLVITQFAFTNLMLICTVIIAAQMDFMKSKDLGFNFDRVVTIDFPDGAYLKMDAIAGEYRSKSYVEDVSKSRTTPLSNSNWNNSYFIKGEEYIDGNNANIKHGDKNYLDFYDIELLSGRNIAEQHINDSTYDIIVNEKLLTTLGWKTHEEAIGQWIDMGYIEGKVIGVMEDYNVRSLQYGLKPAIFMYKSDEFNQLAIRLKSEPSPDVVADIEATFRQFYPNDLFEFEVLKDEIQDHYVLENMLHQIIKFVSVLSILLGTMGLYGLVSFMTNKNAKDIGVRKVFGASVASILGIFGREYTKLMLIAFVVAAPLAYWLMSLWMEEFAYRIDITYGYFVIAFGISFAIALGTVGYRSFRAATANPIQSLRYE